MAMMAIKGIYAEYGVQRLNHGIGFDTAAIELLLPTYAESLGLKGKICQHWALNPHPALIPAIEAGWVQSVHSFGSEMGMENYIAARPDVFFTGADGSMRSNRALCQAAGHYACDLFIGSTLQIDLAANSSTATLGRIAGFGGAPNMGADARGRRHASPAWLKAGQQAHAGLTGAAGTPRGRKLVVQMVETFREHMQPAFVETLDAWALAEQAKMPLPPIMIYGDDVTHILTEEGIANLLLCRSDEEREQAVRGVAGYTAVGLGRDRRDGREPARPRRDPAARGPGHRPAPGHAQPAGRALDARPGRRLGRPLCAARALQELVRGRTMDTAPGLETPELRIQPAASRPAAFAPVLVGVVGSGNLELLMEPLAAPVCRVDVQTSARGFGAIWEAVSARFPGATRARRRGRHHPRHGRHAGRGGAAAGAGGGGDRIMNSSRISYAECSARERIARLFDAGSFHEWLPPSARVMSPHLAQLGVPAAFDDGVAIGRALLDGHRVFVAAQEGEFMGGGVGEVHGAKLVGLFRRALRDRRPPRP